MVIVYSTCAQQLYLVTVYSTFDQQPYLYFLRSYLRYFLAILTEKRYTKIKKQQGGICI